jgi:PleD family two-component response regulator
MGIQRDPGFLRRLARRLFSPTHLRILLVDPDLEGVRHIASALAREHATIIVGSAAEAFSALQKSTPSLVAAELDLPDTSGLALLTALHAHPLTQRVPFLMLSRSASLQDKIAAFQAGADDFLVKPVDPAIFADHVRRLVYFRQLLPSSGS